MLLVPESSLALGFYNDPIGTHGSRTIMLGDLRLLLAACPDPVDYAIYRSLVLDTNVLLKKTISTRRESLRRLRELYALAGNVPISRVLRTLWPVSTTAQPLLALLCACARDPILRASADLILDTPPGVLVMPQHIEAAVERAFPERYNQTTLANIGRHAASSWQQSGHLVGRSTKLRSRATCCPENAVYALLLGYLCDVRGEALFHTLWARLLDTPPDALHQQAFAASQRGWLEYHRAGGVVEVGFRHLLPEPRLPNHE